MPRYPYDREHMYPVPPRAALSDPAYAGDKAEFDELLASGKTADALKLAASRGFFVKLSDVPEAARNGARAVACALSVWDAFRDDDALKWRQ